MPREPLDSLPRCFLSTTNDESNEIYADEKVPDSGEWAGCKRSFMAPLKVGVRGSDILYHPLYNKGTAFKSGERDRLRFRGLLPTRPMNIQLQKECFLLIQTPPLHHHYPLTSPCRRLHRPITT